MSFSERVEKGTTEMALNNCYRCRADRFMAAGKGITTVRHGAGGVCICMKGFMEEREESWETELRCLKFRVPSFYTSTRGAV